MGKRKRQGHKRHHHFLPQLYLCGFTESLTSPMLWVYERDRNYSPGLGSETCNPYRRSVTQAGMQRDFYAYQRSDGSMDYETFENALEQEEKQYDRLLKKLREFKPLIGDEKARFTRYITMMLKRVPRSMEKALALWPKVVDEEWERLRNELGTRQMRAEAVGDEESLKLVQSLKERVDETMVQRQGVMPDKLRLTSMLRAMPRMEDVILAMRWQYLRAPIGEFFVTSDNPVFYFEGWGFNKPYSEFTFPISSNLAIVGSWHHNEPECIIDVTSAHVREVNRRATRSALRFVYARAADRHIYDLLNSDDGHYLFYPPLANGQRLWNLFSDPNQVDNLRM